MPKSSSNVLPSAPWARCASKARLIAAQLVPTPNNTQNHQPLPLLLLHGPNANALNSEEAPEASGRPKSMSKTCAEMAAICAQPARHYTRPRMQRNRAIWQAVDLPICEARIRHQQVPRACADRLPRQPVISDCPYWPRPQTNISAVLASKRRALVWRMRSVSSADVGLENPGNSPIEESRYRIDKRSQLRPLAIRLPE